MGSRHSFSTCFRRVFRPSSGAQTCSRYWSDTVCVVLSFWWWTENIQLLKLKCSDIRGISDKFNIHKSVYRQYILRVQPKRCNVSQFIYLCKTLNMFQTGFPSINRNSKLYIQGQAFVRTIPDAVCAFLSFWRKTPLKHVERLTEINKLWNCEVREKSDKMQQLDVYYQILRYNAARASQIWPRPLPSELFL